MDEGAHGSAAGRDRLRGKVSGDASDAEARDIAEADVALKLLHTADWHLGMPFPSFEREDRLRLSRARLEVIDRILGLARHHAVDAILCAGDLFDDADPAAEWWQGLLDKLRARPAGSPPVFLLPGNHDPLTETGVFSPTHAFRAGLPDGVHVVDRDDYRFELSSEAVLFAAPCRSRSDSRDLALSCLPERGPGDDRLRVGMVHGVTFDLPGHEMNFPIALDAAERKGLDYLAIGDTHGFRDVTPKAHAPTIYPGAPEPTRFGEEGAGHVAIAYLPRDRRRRALVQKHRVARHTWERVTCTDMDELRELAERDLSDHVLRLVLDMVVDVERMAEAERVLTGLVGTSAVHGRVGVLELDRSRLRLDARGAGAHFESSSSVLAAAAARLEALQRDAAGSAEAELARRALYQLYQLTREAR